MWTSEIHSIINNGLLGLSLTTTVRYTFIGRHGYGTIRVVGSTEITPEASADPSIHHIIFILYDPQSFLVTVTSPRLTPLEFLTSTFSFFLLPPLGAIFTPFLVPRI